MKRGLLMFWAVALVVAACGGDDADESASNPSTATESPTEAEGDGGTESSVADTPTTQPAASDEPVASGEEGTGTATIGDTTWEFAFSGNPSEMCDLDVNDAGFLLIVLLFGTDATGREIALNISGPVSGGDTDVLVQAGSPTLQFERWTADPLMYDRLSGIEGMPEGVGATLQVDGNTVSGSGVFFDDETLTRVRPTGGPYDAGVLDGTFSATCPAS